MSNIDKKAVQAIADLKAGYTLGHADVAILNELARIALASLEAEPVAYIRDGFRADGVHFCGGIITAEEHERTKPALSDRYNWKHQPLYTAPPAPVVPEEATPENIAILASTFAPRGVTYQWDRDECNAAADSWNACRDAMLQGADGNSPVIPDGWVACSDRMPETMVSALVTGTWFHHAVAFWDGLSWCDLDFEQPVTHWMPLPAAPQQEVK